MKKTVPVEHASGETDFHKSHKLAVAMSWRDPRLRPHVDEVAAQLRAEWRKRGSRDIPLFWRPNVGGPK